jgi:hypothetical protein
MRVNNIKLRLEIPVPLSVPDENGVIYKEQALINACKDANNLPIRTYIDNDNFKINGVATSIKYENGHIIVDGYFNYGGTEEMVEIEDGIVTTMTIQSFGITD